MCYLQVRPPLRDWRELGQCQVIIRLPGGGRYGGVAVNSEGLLAVTDDWTKCVHLYSKEGALVKPIENSELKGYFGGITFDLEGNVWVAAMSSCRVLQLSQYGQKIKAIDCAGSKLGNFNCPTGVSVSPEGLICICDWNNHRVTIHDAEGKFQFAVRSMGSSPGCFGRPRDATFGSDGFVYVTEIENRQVCVWSKEGTFQREFETKYEPYCIAATGDNHLVITSFTSNTVMVYTLRGQLVHEFGERGSDPGRFRAPYGICVDDSGLVYVVDCWNNRVQVF